MQTKNSCPNCSQIFTLPTSTPKHGKDHSPHLLQCGHSICQTCLTTIVRRAEPVECRVCCQVVKSTPEEFKALSDPSYLEESFPKDLYTLGKLYLATVASSNNAIQDSLKHSDCYVDVDSIVSSGGKCTECGKSTTTMCQTCSNVFCKECFVNVHNSYQFLKSHTIQEIEPQLNLYTCNEHKESSLVYFCEKCNKIVCVDCVVICKGDKSCKDHPLKSIKEKNTELAEELNAIQPDVSSMLYRLTKTAVDIGTLLREDGHSSAGSTLNGVVVDALTFFSQAHAVLQTTEKKMLNSIIEMKKSNIQSLLECQKLVVEYIKNANDILRKINSGVKDENVEKVNLMEIYNDAVDLANNLPWFITKKNSNPVKMVTGEDILKQFSECVSLQGDSDGYILVPTKDVPEGVVVPPAPPRIVYPPQLPVDIRENAPTSATVSQPTANVMAPKPGGNCGPNANVHFVGFGFKNKNREDQGQSSKQPLPPTIHNVLPFRENQPLKCLREGYQELVFISHIVDPYNFYVQRVCQQEQVKEMMKEFKGAQHWAKPVARNIEQGMFLLALTLPYNQWNRCQVIGIRMYNQEPVYRVFCFDYGIITEVTYDKLRLLPNNKLQRPPPLAIHCALANCQPIAGAWMPDDSVLMQMIIANKQAVIHVRHIITTPGFDNKYEVDLFTFEDGVNIAHAFMFYERSRRIPNLNISYPKINTLEETSRIFFNNKGFSNSGEEVILTHVGLDKFFLRKCHVQSSYMKLCKELDTTYNLKSQVGTIHCPTVDMVCVVNIDKCERRNCAERGWHRGMVRCLPGKQRVRVFLLDLGETVTVHGSALRRIHQKYTTLNALAVECHLSGVTFSDSKCKQRAADLLQRYRQKLLRAVVDDKPRYRGSLSVTLYTTSDSGDGICINAEIMELKLASYKKSIKLTNRHEAAENSTGFNINNRQMKVLTKATDEVEEEKPKEELQPQEDVQRSKEPLKLEVTVLSCHTPSLIYVTPLDTVKHYHVLYDDMQEYYFAQKLPEQKVNWKVGDRCCGLCQESKTWRRAIIKQIKGELVEVFFTDFALREFVLMKYIRKLPVEFSKYNDAAIKCHLCGITPADGNEWPSMTNEFLKEKIDTYPQTFITKNGDIKDNSLPIELWVYHVTPGAALEPNIKEWKCLNHEIIDQGLAVADETYKVSSKTQMNGDPFSFLNIIQKTDDWLKLEMEGIVSLSLNEDADVEPTTSSYEGPSIADEERFHSLYVDGSNDAELANWLPPLPLPQEFIGRPTNVDLDGAIYLHHVDDTKTITLLVKYMLKYNTYEVDVVETEWAVGDSCVALYEPGNCFCRGTVLEVDQSKGSCTVLYVDYGNEEICLFKDIIRETPLRTLPIQARKCALASIRPPNGTWTRYSLDYVHKVIVANECSIKVVGVNSEGIDMIVLTVNNTCINSHLVECKEAYYVEDQLVLEPESEDTEDEADNPDYIIEEDATANSTKDSFDYEALNQDWNLLMEEELCLDNAPHFPKYPENLFKSDNFQCTVLVVNNVDTIELVITHDEETTAKYSKLTEDILARADEMPELNGVYENKACIALYSEDKEWSRAAILEYSEAQGLVKVKYVDFGNVEILPLSDVREVDLVWIELPPASMPAKLFGVKVRPEVDITALADDYMNMLIEKTLYAKIMNKSDSLVYVQLRYEADGELVYQKLIDNNTFELVI